MEIPTAPAKGFSIGTPVSEQVLGMARVLLTLALIVPGAWVASWGHSKTPVAR